MRKEQERRGSGGPNPSEGKENELARKREQLSLYEAAIKRQEQELKAGEVALKNKKDET